MSLPLPPFLTFSLFPASHSRAILYFPTLLPHARSRPRPPPRPRPRTPSAPYRVLLVELYAPHPSDRSHIHRTTITLTTRLPLFLPFNPPGQLLSGSSCVIDVRRCTGLWRCFSCFRHLIATRYVTLWRTLTHCEVCPPLVDDSSLSTTETIARSVAACRRCTGTLFQRF